MKESEGTDEITIFLLYLYLLQGQQPCPTVSQYELDASVTKATGHLRLTQPYLRDYNVRLRRGLITLVNDNHVNLKEIWRLYTLANCKQSTHKLPRCLNRFYWYQNFTIESITKTRLYNFDPLEPHFYIVKLGFTGVYIICL